MKVEKGNTLVDNIKILGNFESFRSKRINYTFSLVSSTYSKISPRVYSIRMKYFGLLKAS